MRYSNYDQFSIVQSDSAALFNKQLNEEVHRLKDNFPVVEILRAEPPYFAQIKYRVNESTPETISEASAAEGVSFVCHQCPLFKPPLKDDGTEDKRCKAGDCLDPKNELGRVFKNTQACDMLYELIKERSVKLCFME